VVVIEQGSGTNGDGTGGIGRIAHTGPALVFGLLHQLQALGLDLPTVLSQLGINGGKLIETPTKAVESKSNKAQT
jgi:hypothetical protein